MGTLSRTRECNLHSDPSGFTLVELMIALFISGLVIAAIFTVYIAQSKHYSELDDVAAIQQDLRGALVILPLEIRQAGCDPTESGIPKVLAATRTNFHFTLDIAGNPTNPKNADGDVGDANENIAFGFGAGVDTNSNGIVDNGTVDWSGTAALGRQTGGAGGYQPIAENIEAFEFSYVLEDGSITLAPGNLNQIRSVQASILARAPNPSKDFTSTSTYTTAAGTVWNPPDDKYRRRLVVTTINCRNLGY